MENGEEKLGLCRRKCRHNLDRKTKTLEVVEAGQGENVTVSWLHGSRTEVESYLGFRMSFKVEGCKLTFAIMQMETEK